MHFPNAIWRLILSPPYPGAWNMALDEVFLEAATSGRALPTLRFYSWEPPCLSLGHAQPASDVSLSEINSRGWGLVRRTTGGRAILHVDEITYSVAGPENEPRLRGGVLESYRELSKALIRGLQILGIPAQVLDRDKMDARSGFQKWGGIQRQNKSEQNPVCFEVPSHYEITVYGKKLIGSAQARKRSGVLQHGSLPLKGDLTRITQVLDGAQEADREEKAKRLLDRATTIEDVLGTPLAWEDAAQALAAAFRDVLNLELVLDQPTTDELMQAETLVDEKFANDAWTFRL